MKEEKKQLLKFHCVEIENESSVINPNQVNNYLGHLALRENLEMPSTQLEKGVVDERTTIDEAQEVRTEVDDTRRRQKNDGNQFKVACNIYM